jgi:serine O-acetyltransferase
MARPTRTTQATSPEHGALAERLLDVQDEAIGRRLVPSLLPSVAQIADLAEDFLTVLFHEVGRAGAVPQDPVALRDHLADALAALAPRLEQAVFQGIHRQCADPKKEDDCRQRAQGIRERVMTALPEIRALLLKDVQAALEGDPAASGADEIIACYPGLYAIAVYRVAHRLLEEGSEIIPRMLTEQAKSRTGIDIHPGARIGPSFFIDHGTGIVVGETAEIGAGVRIYQGVTLGALSIKRRDAAAAAPGAGARMKRHPTIEDDVIIYANATILGGNTVIGRGAVIGGNTFITYSVPPGIRVGGG